MAIDHQKVSRVTVASWQFTFVRHDGEDVVAQVRNTASHFAHEHHLWLSKISAFSHQTWTIRHRKLPKVVLLGLGGQNFQVFEPW